METTDTAQARLDTPRSLRRGHLGKAREERMARKPIQLVGDLQDEVLSAAEPLTTPASELVVAFVRGRGLREVHKVDPAPECGQGAPVSVLVIDELVHQHITQAVQRIERERTDRTKVYVACLRERGQLLERFVGVGCHGTERVGGWTTPDALRLAQGESVRILFELVELGEERRRESRSVHLGPAHIPEDVE